MITIPAPGHAVPLLLLAFLSSGEAPAAPPPLTVSPGGAHSIEEIAHPCPTFLWGARSASSATGALELAVYELPAPGDRPGEGWARDAIDSLEPVLLVRLPATAPGWTPPLHRCLSAGGEYAWAVRAVTDDQPDPGGWSAVRVFRVARRAAVGGGPSDERDHPEHADPPAGGSAAGAGAAPAQMRLAIRPSRSGELSPGPSIHHIGAGVSAPDPLTAPVSLRLSEGLALGPTSAITKDGDLLLWDDGTNLALGRGALSSNATGADSTALGAGALAAQTTGAANTAIGRRAFFTNAEGSANVAIGADAMGGVASGSWNVAIGRSALAGTESFTSDTVAVGTGALQKAPGSFNTAIGAFAMQATTEGSDNIAIGFLAGNGLVSGSNNILIGNGGSANLSNAIRIGNSFVHQTASIAGDLGLGTLDPANRLHVVDSSSASSLAGHVAQVENSSTGTSADVLALKIGRTDAPGAGNNLITFYDGNDAILGQCEGNGAGGVVCISSGADYAEFLPRLDPAETLGPGDVVGLFADGVSRRTTGAGKVMVVSTAPLMLGNDPGEDRRNDYEPVAFVGQAPVRVRGPARAGDLLLASGLEDGTAIAVPVAELDPGRLSRVVGRALADHPGDGEVSVRALIGLPDTALLEALLERHERRLDRLERALALSAADSTSP
jgi:hypothetical protein